MKTDLKIVSLLPSATEIVAGLGLQDQLVGRSHECDFPPSICNLPICTESNIDIDGASRQIDQQVKSLIRDALSIYKVQSEVLSRLNPTHIVTQTQCEVCAVTERDVENAVSELVGTCPQIISLNAETLSGVWDDCHTVGNALNAKAAAADLVESSIARLNNIREKASQIGKQPTVACIEWIKPLMSAGNWVPELVEIAGGHNLFGKTGQHSPWMDWEELTSNDPDVIVLMPCGFDIQRTREEMSLMESHPTWQGLQAVRNQQVYLTDGNQYFNRPGPRLVDSAQILAEILHPHAFKPQHQESGWQQYK